MLTLSSEFTEAFKAGSVEPVLLVKLTGTLQLYCSGSRVLEFSDGVYDPFTASQTGSKTAYPSVAAVSSLALVVDPFERNVQRSTVTVTFHDDGGIRALNQAVRLVNQSVIIRLGTAEITAEANWAPVFRGFVKEVAVREGQIDLVCEDFFNYCDRDYYGAYVNRHPLQAIKKILEDCSVPSQLINATALDPAQSQYSDIRHYVVGYEAKTAGIKQAERQALHSLLQVAPTSIEAVNAMERCQILARGMVGTLFHDENGVIQFKRFHLATATVSDHWTADDIGTFEQGENVIINQIDVEISSHWRLGVFPTTSKLSIKDSTSASAYAYTGLSEGALIRSARLDFGDLQGRLFYGIPGSTSGTIDVKVSEAHGISGTRVEGQSLHDPANDWSALQPSGADLDAARPAYFMVEDEIFKAEDGEFLTGWFQGAVQRDAQGSVTPVQVPLGYTFKVDSADRGALNTSAAAHSSGDGWLDPSATPVVDMTIAEGFAQTQLTRFSNGCRHLRVTTNLSKWALQIGDFITLENDFYLDYGVSGLDDSFKWEIIGKELRLDDGASEIVWDLAYATRTSPPSINKVFDWGDRPRTTGKGAGLQVMAQFDAGISRHVVHGLEIAVDSGLVVTLAAGVAAIGMDGQAAPAQSITLPASKDCYVDLCVNNGGVSVTYQAIDAQEPALAIGQVRLAKVVTGASSVTSVTDYRDLGAVKPRNISALDIEGGANLLFNPDFEIWTRGKNSPPDSWEMKTGSTWNTDADQESQEVNTGRYSLKVSGDNKTVQSKLFKVEANRVYDFGAAAVASSSGLTVQAGVEWLTGAKATISTDNVINASGLTTWTKGHGGIVAPATAEFGRAVLTRGAVSGAGGPELLLRLDDNVTDATGSHTCTASYLDPYVASNAGGDGTSDSGFSKAASFSPGGSGAGGTNHSRIAVPDLGIGTGDFTIEWWSFFDVAPNGTRRQVPWSFLISGTSSYLYLAYYNANEFFISDYVNSAYFSSTAFMTRGSGAPKFSHWVVTRKSNGDGTSTLEMFHHGTKLSLASGTDTWTTKDITTMDIGRLTGVSDATYNWGHEGLIDEFAVYDSVISTYDGVSSYTVPTAPISLPSGSSQAYFDSLRMVRSQPSFRAKQTVAQAAIADKNSAAVQFNSEEHDIGGQFDSTTDHDFTVRFDGVYEFEARIQASLSDSPTDAGTTIALTKNGTNIIRNGPTFDDSASSHIAYLSISSGPLKLEAGDVIKVAVYNGTGETLTIAHDGEFTWFAGRQVS